MIDNALSPIVARFDFPGEWVDCEEIVTGHINSTFALTFALPGGGERRYVLQRINTIAFKQPRLVMENVLGVTEHLRKALIARGEDPSNRVLRVIPMRTGEAMLMENGDCWRAYDYITHAVSVDRVDGPEEFFEIGRAFGEFQRMLADYPIEKLHDTIPCFHDTKRRLENFEASVEKDVAHRAAEVGEEIAFVRKRKAEMGRIVEMIADGTLPLRVTHNDTKINNVMLDADTKKALCVIDLDTVMAGSALYDFGDAIRFGASTAAEDERDLSKVSLDLDLFRGFADGFISQTADGLTEAELVNLPLGALVMTFEVGLRFLTDYLDGDVYFRIESPDHNLARCRTQFKLLSDMEAKRGEMDAIVRALIEKHKR